MSTKNNWITSYAGFIIKWRWLVVLFTIIMVVGLSAGARFLKLDTDYRVFFSDKNPHLIAFDKLQQVFSKSDNVMFVIKPKTGDVFQPKVLELIQEITTEGWQLPYSSRVDSITNFQHTIAEGDDLIVADLVEDAPSSYTKKQLEAKKKVAINEPLLRNRLISPDATTTGINVTVQLPGKDIYEVPDVAAAANKMIEKIAPKYPDVKIAISGIIMMNASFSGASIQDMKTLIPFMYLALLVMMFFFLRSFWGTFATLLIISFSAASAMGLAGYLGIHLTPPSAISPTVILTLAIADSIHILVSFFHEMHKGTDKTSAIKESLRINMQPVFLTSFTTVIGFLALNFSDAPPFHDLGNITAMGVVVAFIYSVFLLPALISILPIKADKKPENHHTLIDKLGEFVIANHKKLLKIMLIVAVILIAMIPKIELNDEFVKYFDKSMKFRTDTDFMMENLSGIYTIDYALGAGGEHKISNPQYLKYVDEYTKWLRAQPEVDHVYSITDIFKRLNKNLHGDDESWYKLPDSNNLAAQYLLLYEISLPYGLDLNDRINVKKSATRLSVTLGDLSTLQVKAFKYRSEKWLKDNTPEYMHATGSSPVIMFTYISERNIHSMIKGNIIAFLLISLAIMFALRSIKLGLISLIPNILPAGMAFGVWGLLVGQVNMAVSVVAAVSLGIIVDDTVHFLSKYHRAKIEKGLHTKDAIKYAFSTVGSALTVTTVILVAGFSVLMLSTFEMNSTLGSLTSIALILALLVDFLLLPPLLILIDDMLNKRKGIK